MTKAWTYKALLTTPARCARVPSSALKTAVPSSPHLEKSLTGRWLSISKGCRTGLLVRYTGPTLVQLAISGRTGLPLSRTESSSYFPRGPCRAYILHRVLSVGSFHSCPALHNSNCNDVLQRMLIFFLKRDGAINMCLESDLNSS